MWCTSMWRRPTRASPPNNSLRCCRTCWRCLLHPHRRKRPMPTDDHDDSTDTPRLIPAQPTADYWRTMRRYWVGADDVEVFARVGGAEAAFPYAGITSDGRYQVFVANMRYEQ